MMENVLPPVASGDDGHRPAARRSTGARRSSSCAARASSCSTTRGTPYLDFTSGIARERARLRRRWARGARCATRWRAGSCIRRICTARAPGERSRNRWSSAIVRATASSSATRARRRTRARSSSRGGGRARPAERRSTRSSRCAARFHGRLFAHARRDRPARVSRAVPSARRRRVDRRARPRRSSSAR